MFDKEELIMRRGCSPEIIMNNDDFIGFNLGRDYCFEHEHGIDGLIKMFKITSGEDKKRGCITDLPKDNFGAYDVLIDGEECALLYALNSCQKVKIDDWFFKAHELHTHRLLKHGITCSWCDHGFGILVEDEYRDYIRELYFAFKDKDITFSFGREVCGSPGLKIYITSNVQIE